LRLRAQHLTSADRFFEMKSTLPAEVAKNFYRGMHGSPPKFDKKSLRLSPPKKRRIECYPSHFWRRSKASPPKMTHHTAVPRRKVFAELFSKSDPSRPQAPLNKSNSLLKKSITCFGMIHRFIHHQSDGGNVVMASALGGGGDDMTRNGRRVFFEGGVEII